jgi:hypothetical protein
MNGTKISQTADGSLKIMDGNNNLRKLIVDEVQIGNDGPGNSVVKIKKNATDNTIQIVNVDSAGASTSANFGGGSSTVTYLTGNSFGTELAPISGGVLNVDTATSLSAIIELGSNAGALTINLNPTINFDAKQVGDNGTIVIIERSTTGRSITIDPRIHFATKVNELTNTAFLNSSYMSSTLSNLITSSAPALGGYAVDTISYSIPKIGFAIGNYYRQFKCMPPALVNATQTKANLYTNTAPIVLNLADSTFMSATNSGFYGPLSYSMAPAAGSSDLPATMTLTLGGILTIPINVGYSGTVLVTIRGSAQPVIQSITFDVKPWYVPVIATTPAIPANTDTASAQYVTPAPTVTQAASLTGTLTWSVVWSNPSITIPVSPSTGTLTIPANTSIPTGTTYTLTATGPAPSAYTVSTAAIPIAVKPFKTPTITAFADINTNAALAPYITPAPIIPANSGTIVYSISPASFLNDNVTFNETTGRLTVAKNHGLVANSVTITATNTTYAYLSSTTAPFSISVQPWATVAFTTADFYQSITNNTAMSSYVIAAPTLVNDAQDGTNTWSVTPAEFVQFLNTSTGSLTIPMNHAYNATSVTLTSTGPTGLGGQAATSASDAFTVTMVPWNTPTVSAMTVTSSAGTGQTFVSGTSYTTSTQPVVITPTQGTAGTGAFTWSLVCNPVNATVSGYMNTAGVITIPQNIALTNVSCTLTATGQAAANDANAKLTGSRTFTLNTVVWVAPVITLADASGAVTVGSTFTKDVTSSSYVLTASVGNSAQSGTVSWLMTAPATLPTGVTFNTTTRALTVASGYAISSRVYTFKATGPSGIQASVNVTLTTIVPPLFPGSTILFQKHTAPIKTLLPSATSFQLLYRGSSNGWSNGTYKQLCKGQSPLFFVIQSTTGYIGTVYAPVTLTVPSSGFQWLAAPSGSAWLNNLENSGGTLSTTKAFNDIVPSQTLFDSADHSAQGFWGYYGGGDLRVNMSGNAGDASKLINTTDGSSAGFSMTTMFGSSPASLLDIEIYKVI